MLLMETVESADGVSQKARDVISAEGFDASEFSISVVALPGSASDSAPASGTASFALRVRKSGTRYEAEYWTGAEQWTRLLADELRHGYFNPTLPPRPARSNCG